MTLDVSSSDRPNAHQGGQVDLLTFDPRPDIRLIAADLDGTLLNDERELHAHFWPLISELASRGIVFCPASGRQFANVRQVFADLADEMTFIVENGAYVLKGATEISSDAVAEDVVTRVVLAARAFSEAGGDIGVVVCGKRSAYFERPDEAFTSHVDEYYTSQLLVPDLLARPADDVLKIAIYDFAGSEHSIAPALASFAAEMNIVVSGQNWVDVMNLGTNKGVGLRHLQEALGVTRAQTMVFGDFLNDLEMMDEADYSFAMENAHPILRERARYLAPPNSQNGVIRTISSILGLPWTG